VLDECPDKQLAPPLTQSSTGAGTARTLVDERLESLHDAMPGVAAQVEHGWAEVVEKLVPAG
jgi:hypothetical protein